MSTLNFIHAIAGDFNAAREKWGKEWGHSTFLSDL